MSCWVVHSRRTCWSAASCDVTRSVSNHLRLLAHLTDSLRTHFAHLIASMSVRHDKRFNSLHDISISIHITRAYAAFLLEGTNMADGYNDDHFVVVSRHRLRYVTFVFIKVLNFQCKCVTSSKVFPVDECMTIRQYYRLC